MDEIFYIKIKEIVNTARNNAYRTINSIMIEAYYNVGKNIVEEEQKGEKRAKYGDELIKTLSLKLTKEFGKGFDERNLRNMRYFFIRFPNWNALRSELSWTHYRLLLKVKEERARDYYLTECVIQIGVQENLIYKLILCFMKEVF